MPSPPSRGHFAPLEYHRQLLDDPVRMDAYERAIRALVRPGDVVLDLGCGSAILSLLSARRGAARVHAVESAPIASLAERLVAENGLSHQITIHHQDFLSLEPIEPVDLVISDFMGRFVVDDRMLEAVQAARQWLRPNTGRFCPREVQMQLAPVADVQLFAIELFAQPLYGFDLRSALPYAYNYCYHAQLSPEALLCAPQSYATLQPPEVPARFDRELRFVFARDGLLQGVAGWFDALLAPEILLSTGPGIETHWGQYLFPLPPIAVVAGDSLHMHLRLDSEPHDVVWRWAGEVLRGDSVLASFALESEQKLGQR